MALGKGGSSTTASGRFGEAMRAATRSKMKVDAESGEIVKMQRND